MSADVAASPMAMETDQRPWWLSLIGGILAMVVGAVMLWGSTTTRVNLWLMLVQLLGLYWLITGILDLVHMFTDHRGWGWKLLMGVISIVAGAYILMYPIATALALPEIFVFVLGIWALIEGCILLFMAFKGGGLTSGVLGALGIVLGLMLMGTYSQPGMGLSLIWFGAVAALVGGAVMIWHALKARKAVAG
jgi:uncharacterized membrane protein HdeD (DUF308 family)